MTIVSLKVSYHDKLLKRSNFIGQETVLVGYTKCKMNSFLPPPPPLKLGVGVLIFEIWTKRGVTLDVINRSILLCGLLFTRK